MNKAYVDQVNSRFKEEQERLNLIKPGDTVYITDAYFDFFECKVMSVQLDEGTITVEDLSLVHIYPKKEDRIKEISSFYTVDEANVVWKTDGFKSKPF